MNKDEISLEIIQQQATALEIDLSIDGSTFDLDKRGGSAPNGTFANNEQGLEAAQQVLENYRQFLGQAANR